MGPSPASGGEVAQAGPALRVEAALTSRQGGPLKPHSCHVWRRPLFMGIIGFVTILCPKYSHSVSRLLACS